MMTEFFRLLADEEKSSALLSVCFSLKSGADDNRAFNVDTDSFRAVPGTPFAYWVSDQVRSTFENFQPFERDGRVVRQGLATADDFRFVRAWWEVSANNDKWPGFAKGGKFSPFYADVFLVVNWGAEGAEIKNNLNERGGSGQTYGCWLTPQINTLGSQGSLGHHEQKNSPRRRLPATAFFRREVTSHTFLMVTKSCPWRCSIAPLLTIYLR
ncbi:hypothetical protein [Porphyrobacter sp. LM 6]|uniref:hypothetical protein n=1 Tax=Porphyrobacter sp. LM 6 TaxID=1896196 RepID=UPI000863BFAA|nr:hypothetical protein [Porphyrobacter sp. LM 6]AOL93938.1 hypothetical protein BG023_11997 [Porphyrobacter sp. LM 6]